MTDKLRILITGFGPFPGAPYNPSEALVLRLARLRRPALDDVQRVMHIFPVTYSAVDQQLPKLIGEHRPHALLMFGLAARTLHLRVETRARNTITQIWPDAGHTRVLHRGIEHDAPVTINFGAHTQRLLQAAKNTGIDARASISAGYYLCNYLSWRAIETVRADNGPKFAAFIHIPLVSRTPSSERRTAVPRITFEQLVDAGEAILMETVRTARHMVKI